MNEPKDVRLEIAGLKERLGELERRQRRWRWTGLIAAAGVVVALMFGSMSQPSRAQDDRDRGDRARSDMVVAQRIAITDAAGRRRMVLGLVDGVGPALVIYNNEGQAQLMLAGQETGPAIYMYDTNLKLRSRLQLNEAIGPSLVFRDPAGRERAILALIQERPGLSLLDAEGRAIWKTP